MSKTIKIVMHEDSGKIVVNMPGTGMRPHVFRSLDKALAFVRDLTE